MEKYMTNTIDIVSPDEPLSPFNFGINVIMSVNQYKYMLYCVDYVERIRENARKQNQKRINRVRETQQIKPANKKVSTARIPGTQSYKNYQNKLNQNTSNQTESLPVLLTSLSIL